MQIFFISFLIHIHLIIVLSIKTEIKFNINVPSIFRCKRNGRVFYFDNFPTNQLFNQIIINQTNDCNLSLLTSDKRIIFDVEKLISQCNFKFSKFEDRINEILFFKSNCSINDRCIRLTPSFATIITNHRTTISNKPTLLDFDIRGIGTENIQIGEEDQYIFSLNDDGYMKRGFRKNRIVFKMKQDKYLNMMCEYTYINNPKNEKSICRFKYGIFKNFIQTRSGKMTSSGEGWTWLCYYYPSGAEDPIDDTMINRAIEDLEKANLSKFRILPELQFLNLTEFLDNSSMSLNKTNQDSLIPIFILLLILIIVGGGIFYMYKKKYQIVLKESDDPVLARSSVESQNSIISNEIENDPSCDLLLSSIDQRAIIEIDKLDLLCEILNKKKHANEFLLFSSKCSKDLCRKFIPTTATIITEYKTGDRNIEKINIIFRDNNHSSQLMIGHLTEDKYLVEEFEKINPKGTRILLRKLEDNQNNSLLSSDKTLTNDLSKMSTFMLLFLILFIIICGICCYNKKKTNNKLINNRSSEESQYSPEILDETSIE
ncbi:unnamed protein product [Rotaria sordida]|uniref:Uncharacterized protein n=1 Tax=Rotaria sordida TaxID=392033 RepID=A0A814WU81_9BILA|nr:unnamed protein product [Rotaria sordida]CAF1009023.1 unnamed protein product [Rotaria sordida]CAF1205588.1 unnamed protein product [Rotaria sordida]CAF3609478.1 unnamed protein product [Rotaria sordida]